MKEWWTKHVRLASRDGEPEAWCRLCPWHATYKPPSRLRTLEQMIELHLYERHSILPPMPPKRD